MMKSFGKTIAKLTLCAIFLCFWALPCLAQVRRVPTAAVVEQGLNALILDVEGAENFRYAGQKDKTHIYLGKILPGGKLKFVVRGELKNEKELPITSRSLLVRMRVVAKKGDAVIKTENFSKANVSNLFLNYTAPREADTLEVTETFALTNKSQESKFNQRVTTVNKLILSTADNGTGAVASNQANTGSQQKTVAGVTEKQEANGYKNAVDVKKDNAGKTVTNSSKAAKKKEVSPEEAERAEKIMRVTRIVSGTAFLILLAGVGGHFFLKNRKSNQIAAEKLARRERLRLQAIERQKSLQKNGAAQEVTQNNRQESMREEEQPPAMREPDNPQANDPQTDNLQAATVNAAAASGAEQARFCQNCGAPLKPGSRFCENCGFSTGQ